MYISWHLADMPEPLVSYVHLNQPSWSRCGDLTRVSIDAESRELHHCSLFQRACSFACDVLRFSIASFVSSSTRARLILWIQPTFCAQVAFLTAVPTNNVLAWIRVLVLTFFLAALAITFPFLAFLTSFAKAVHLPSDLRCSLSKLP